METKKFTQFGTFYVIVMLPIFIFSLIMLFMKGFDNFVMGAVFSVLAVSLLICLLIFYKISIYINETYISFKLGIGLVSKKYLIADIKSCKPVKNEPLFGIGIKIIPNGMLYNVSGLQAIELTFKNRKSKIRIGTNQPEEIASTINKMIENEKSESTSTYTKKTNYYLTLTIIILALILPIGIILSGKREMKINMTNSDFSFKGIYGLTIKYSDIKQLDTISFLPRIGLRTNGYAFGKTLKGNFTLNDRTKVKLFITKGTPPYILIKTENDILYINFKNPDKTVDLFNALTTNLRHEQK